MSVADSLTSSNCSVDWEGLNEVLNQSIESDSIKPCKKTRPETVSLQGKQEEKREKTPKSTKRLPEFGNRLQGQHRKLKDQKASLQEQRLKLSDRRFRLLEQIDRISKTSII